MFIPLFSPSSWRTSLAKAHRWLIGLSSFLGNWADEQTVEVHKECRGKRCLRSAPTCAAFNPSFGGVHSIIHGDGTGSDHFAEICFWCQLPNSLQQVDVPFFSSAYEAPPWTDVLQQPEPIIKSSASHLFTLCCDTYIYFSI